MNLEESYLTVTIVEIGKIISSSLNIIYSPVVRVAQACFCLVGTPLFGSNFLDCLLKLELNGS